MIETWSEDDDGNQTNYQGELVTFRVQLKQLLEPNLSKQAKKQVWKSKHYYSTWLKHVVDYNNKTTPTSKLWGKKEDH